MSIEIKKTGERQVGKVAEDIREDHRRRYEWSIERIPPNSEILDAGCGVGYGSNILLEKAKSVMSVDISEEAISFAKKYWSNTKINFFTGDLHFLTLPKKSLDVIVAFEVIEHLIAPALFLKTAHQSLKDTGSIFISVPNELKIPHSVNLNPFHFRHYLSAEAESMMEESGFKLKDRGFQNDALIFDEEEGNFIIYHFEKIPFAHSQKAFSNETKEQFSQLETEVHKRSECISLLKANERKQEYKSATNLEKMKKLAGLRDKLLIDNTVLSEKFTLLDKYVSAGNLTPEKHLEFVDLKNQVVRLKGELSKLQSADNTLRNKELEVIELKNKIDCLLNHEKELDSTVLSLNTALTKLHDEVSTLRIKELETIELKSKIDRTLTREKELDNKVSILNNELLNLQNVSSELRSKELKVIELKSKIDRALTREKELDNKVSSLINDLEHRKQKIAKLEQDVFECTKRESKLKENIEENVQNYTFVEKYLKSNLANEKAWSHQKIKEIQALTKKIDNEKRHVFKLDGINNRQNTELAMLADKILINDKVVQKLQNALAEKSRNSESYKKAMNHSKQQVDRSLKKIERLNILNTKNTSENEYLKFEIEDLNSKVRSLSKKKSLFYKVKDTLHLKIVRKRHIKLVNESGLFDKIWYLKQNKDVAKSLRYQKNPVAHYVDFGAKEGRLPSMAFDTRRYFSDYKDLSQKIVNPVVHYVNFGKKECRKINVVSYT